MSEQRSFWQRLMGRGGGSSLSQRQQKVLGYMIGRLDKNVPLQEMLREAQGLKRLTFGHDDEVVRKFSGPHFSFPVSRP